jgi:tRNA A37 threonylcarbamoyladenosine dehydratase
MTADSSASGAADADLERRFGALSRIYGQSGAARIRDAHVAVVGIGGVGSWAVEALARSGVARITLIDMDHVAESNVNRQIHALTATIGMSKIGAMEQRVLQINPQAALQCVDDFVTPENWPDILPSGVNAVIDACDQISAKYAMAQWSLKSRIPFVTVGAAGGKRLGQAVEVQDLADVTHDPLLAKMRYRLRREKLVKANAARMNVACVFSREPVQKPVQTCETTNDGSLNCHGYGSMVSVTAVFGMVAAGWVIEKLSNSVRMTKISAII